MSSTQVISWGDQLITGWERIDDEHRQLIDIINTLGKLRAHEASIEEIQPALIRLRDYTIYHFQTETDLMNTWPVNEANKAAHLKAHDGFIEILRKAEQTVKANSAAVIDQLLAFLVKWLVHHITGIDMRLAQELRALKIYHYLHEKNKPSQKGGELHNALINTVSDLYDSLGARSFEMLELNQQLQRYHDEQEAENALAQDIILRLMQRGELSNPQLHYWFSPATRFSGDIISSVREPKGQVYALLADATGHGLAAAITVLPVLTAFHAMAQRGLPLTEILSEINRHLRATIPVGRFVAATLICIEEAEKTAQVWIGGMPDLLLFDPDGQLAQQLTSIQLPLGIIDSNVNEFDVGCVSWETGYQFALFSDGLVEATNPAGEFFGIERIVELVRLTPPDHRISSIKDALLKHMDSASPHDDVSLLLIDCMGS